MKPLIFIPEIGMGVKVQEDQIGKGLQIPGDERIGDGMFATEGQELDSLFGKIKTSRQLKEPFMGRKVILMGITALLDDKITQIIKGRSLLQIKIQIRRITLDIRGHHTDGIRGNGRAFAKTGSAVKAESDHVQALWLQL